MALPQFSFSLLEAYGALRPLGLFVVGITVYGVFIFNFYRFLSRKNIFNLDLESHNQARLRFIRKSISTFFYIIKFLIIFPVFVFVWFVVLAALLSVMAKNQPIGSVLLVAMSVVGAIRITAYYNEALSTDLAKILPFALLGIMIIDSSLISIPDPRENLGQALALWETLAYYLVAAVLLEFILRVGTGIYSRIKNASERAEERLRERREGTVEAQPEPEVVPAQNIGSD